MNTRAFDPRIERLRSVAAALPDRRPGDNTRYSMAAIALAAFAGFFTQCPSFLSGPRAMEQSRGRNNARSLFQVERIPSDNHIRQTLDPVAPHHLFSLFDELPRAFAQAGLLEEMRAVPRPRLIALDATGYFSSQSRNICCPNCSCLQQAGGKTTHFHSASTPGIVSPGPRQVVPLRPEFIIPQDGQVKQDCEITAAKRWLAAHAARYAPGNDPLLGDDLYAQQPFCRQVWLHGFPFLFTCRPASHATLHQWVEGLEPGRQLHPLTLRLKGKAHRREHPQYRGANNGPPTDSDDALKVNWGELTIPDAQGAVRYRNSLITDWPISADNVAGRVAAGRARWKIENEHNNGLKNRGYHREHNFGHGKEQRSSLLATMHLLAFGLHTLLELGDGSYRLIRATVGARRRFFQHLEALTSYLHFESWERLMDFMMRGLEIGPYAVQKN